MHTAAAMTASHSGLAWQALLLLCDPMVAPALQLILLLYISLPQSRHIARRDAPDRQSSVTSQQIIL